jgi:hypothetical protein
VNYAYSRHKKDQSEANSAFSRNKKDRSIEKINGLFLNFKGSEQSKQNSSEAGKMEEKQ